ncbi:MAG: 3-hydroxyacyl-CoA dehydrogenase [Herbaspirillum sp.]|nr:3-hydroxyacyl-CoA dehydrogenase [Herbaspirillum sp.]
MAGDGNEHDTLSNDNHRSLRGKHAVVTGGAGGIGGAIARALAAQGAGVTLLGRSESALIGAVEALKKERSTIDAAYVCADVSDRAAVAVAFAAAAQRFGRIDILVNNAGQAASAPFGKIDDAQWQQMLAVNLNGTFYCTQQALPAMLEEGWGRIVNVASMAGLNGYAYVAAYCAAKHGVIGLTRALACEVAGKGVTVNAVCPGYTETAMTQRAIAGIIAGTGRSEAQARAALLAANSQLRMVQAEEVADAVAALCRPGSAATNGQSIVVDGGESAG